MASGDDHVGGGFSPGSSCRNRGRPGGDARFTCVGSGGLWRKSGAKTRRGGAHALSPVQVSAGIHPASLFSPPNAHEAAMDRAHLASRRRPRATLISPRSSLMKTPRLLSPRRPPLRRRRLRLGPGGADRLGRSGHVQRRRRQRLRRPRRGRLRACCAATPACRAASSAIAPSAAPPYRRKRSACCPGGSRSTTPSAALPRGRLTSSGAALRGGLSDIRQNFCLAEQFSA